MNRLAKLAVVGTTGLAILGVAPGAWAYFTATGTAETAVRVDTVNPPTNVTAEQTDPGVGTVRVSWHVPTARSLPLTGYYVERLVNSTASPACGSSPAALLTQGPPCDDTGVPAGSYSYRVTAVYRSFTAASTLAPVTVAIPAPVAGPTA
jgi:hypothetical protein